MVAAVGRGSLATAATGIANSRPARAGTIRARGFMVGSLHDGCRWRPLTAVHQRPATSSLKIVDLVTRCVTPAPEPV
jgi:hypothetical protein